MALKRPKPKQLSAEAVKNIMTASAEQTGSTKAPKTYDPNFPVFSIPVDKKVLVYIPNYTQKMPDGSETLRMDKFAAHQCRGRNTFATVRCTSGLVDESLGLDGSCPFCDSMSEVWELYNKQYSEIARAKGYADTSDPAAVEALKDVRRDLRDKMAIQSGAVFYTFPIVVIDCEEKDGEATTTPKKDAEGRISGKVYWYSIRESTYEDKWAKALETVTLDDDSTPTNPAGLWAVLNYKVAKNQEANAMNSAKALNVGFKTMPASYNDWATYFDNLAEEWTPAKAMETVVANVLRDGEEQAEACDEIMKGTRDKLAMYALGTRGVGAAPQIGNADANATLAAFGATPVGAIAESPAGAPPAANISDIPQTGVQ